MARPLDTIVARVALFALLVGVAAPATRAQTPQTPPPVVASRALETSFIERLESGSLFDNVVAVLQKRYYDEDFRKRTLPALVKQYRPRAVAATTLAAQREVVFDLLSQIPASHLGLLSGSTHLSLVRDLEGVSYPMLGFQLIDQPDGAYAAWVLEDGPAARAGLLPWDRVVSLDDENVSVSPLVDWRSDDAYMPDPLDPGMHLVTAPATNAVRVRIERRPGEFRDLSIEVASYSVFAAETASVRVISENGRRIGYIHLWNVPLAGVPALLSRALNGTFAGCDGVIVDLRGRGGSAAEVPKIVDALKDDREKRQRPIVALIDRQSRSAKDVLAYEFKAQHVATLVGEPTAGAVVPASFAKVGHDSVLMLPAGRLPKYSDLLEQKPVAPDVPVARAGPFSAGQDPILDAGVAEVVKRLGKGSEN